MTRLRSAGDLRARFAFDERVEYRNGSGSVQGAWQEKFQRRAGVVHMRGGESVMAGRLQGLHTQIIFVRLDRDTRRVRGDWRVRDVRSGEFVDGEWTGTEFNVRDLTPTEDGHWLDLLVQSGGAV